MSMKDGFTLVEVLVVIAIIGILAGIMIGVISSGREKARISKAESDLDVISKGIQLMTFDTGEWPGHQEPDIVCTNLPGGCPANNELEDLSTENAGLKQNDSSDPYNSWQGPYINFEALDPWGNNYFFDTDYDIDFVSGTEWRAVIGSYGPDGRELNGYQTGFAEDDIYVILAD